MFPVTGALFTLISNLWYKMGENCWQTLTSTFLYPQSARNFP